MNGGLNKEIHDKWSIFHCPCLITRQVVFVNLILSNKATTLQSFCQDAVSHVRLSRPSDPLNRYMDLRPEMMSAEWRSVYPDMPQNENLMWICGQLVDLKYLWILHHQNYIDIATKSCRLSKYPNVRPNTPIFV